MFGIYFSKVSGFYDLSRGSCKEVINLVKNELEDFIAELVESNPDISSIWLIGSRANHTAEALSDWDILVFANEKIFSELEKNEYFHRGAVDLLVVTDGDNFKKPYGGEKSGSLSRWKWKEISANEAEYEGIKFVPDEAGSNHGEIFRKTLNALLMYRKGN